MPTKKETGAFGEKLVRDYLRKRGYKILYKNFRIGREEIDIIARAQDRTLIFCEVKTIRGDDAQFSPEDHFNSFKQKRVSASCQMFAGKHPNLVERPGYRIDLATVSEAELSLTDNKKDCVIRYYENVIQE